MLIAYNCDQNTDIFISLNITANITANIPKNYENFLSARPSPQTGQSAWSLALRASVALLLLLFVRRATRDATMAANQ